MNNKCILIIVPLLLIIAVGAYKFILQGSTAVSTDGRTSILLNPQERDLVLAEMRMFLSTVQQINTGIAEGDLKLVSKAARAVGASAQAAVPGTLIGKLPLEFKQLGFDTHTKFDQLALDNDDIEDAQLALSQLSNLMQNCVACHEAYRIDLEGQE